MIFFLRKSLIIFSLILSTSNSFASCEFDQPQDRVALIIGNTQYNFVSPLNNPSNDAKAVANILRHYEYSVIERTDLALSQMLEAITCFEDTLKPGGVGVFYYAGHGIQLGQHNYLLPIDLKIDEDNQNKENQIRSKSLDFNDILTMLTDAKLTNNIIILDACRNNPFKEKSRGLFRGKVQLKLEKIAEQGFAEISELSAPARSYIAFATGPGRTSSDGAGENGLFTSHLLKYMDNADLDVSIIFAKTAAKVYKDSKQYQIPWRKTSLFDSFYFSPPHMRSKKIISNNEKPFTVTNSESAGFLKYFNKGKQLLHEKSRPKKALLMFKKALKHSQTNSDLFYEMAIANSNLFNHGQAIYFLKKAVAINPEHPSAYTLLSHSYLKLGDGENAKHFRTIK